MSGTPSQRSDARRRRRLILTTAVEELREGRQLEIQRVAAAAGVSRSTVHRHFGSVEGLQAALVEDGLAQVRDAIERDGGLEGAVLADLRHVTTFVVEAGASHGLSALDARLLLARAEPTAELLVPLARRVAEAADLEAPPTAWLRTAVSDLLMRGLQADSPEALFRLLTEPLDRGLVALDGRGRLLAANHFARAVLGIDAGHPREPVVPRNVHYEDGTPCPPEAHPLMAAVTSGQSQPPLVRGHRQNANGELRWYVIEATALRLSPDASPYGFLGVLIDITQERRAQLEQLPAAGTLGRNEPLILDVARVLDEVPPYLLAEQLVAEARRLVKTAVALYVVDIDGSHLRRLAGADDFPERLEAPLALGPELAPDGIPDLRYRLAAALPGVSIAPMWLRGRAVGLLLAVGGSEELLTEVARQGAAAIELGNGYTDTLDAARRRKDINPAAEIQQSLLPPRIARLGSGEVAGGVLPAYDVGGDWFDYVENRDGAWLAIADASGRGPHAAALGSIGLAALRAARRNEADLEDAMRTIHETIWDAGEEDFYLTAIVARWSSPHRSFSWVNAGHPPPLLVRPGREIEELGSDPNLPLGLVERKSRFRRHHRIIAPGEKLLLYTDGISKRPTQEGLFGVDGIAKAVREAADDSASAVARAIQTAVVEATTDLLRDDAAVVVFAPDPSVA